MDIVYKVDKAFKFMRMEYPQMMNQRFFSITTYTLTVWLFLFVYSTTANASIMVLDFELKDLTIYENNTQEIERTAKFKPMLEQALIDLDQYKIISFNIHDQRQADIGRGYLYDHHNLVADLGKANNAKWVVVGRVHKPSYLFSYLKVQLIDVTNRSMAADLTVELKGQQDKFLKKSVKRLAIQINEAIDHYSQ